MKKLALALAVLTFCGAAQAKEGDLIVRMRAISVTPDVSSTSTLNAINADVNTKVVPELDFTYMWTQHRHRINPWHSAPLSQHKLGQFGQSKRVATNPNRAIPLHSRR